MVTYVVSRGAETNALVTSVVTVVPRPRGLVRLGVSWGSPEWMDGLKNGWMMDGLVEVYVYIYIWYIYI